jgi:hypothetical protein
MTEPEEAGLLRQAAYVLPQALTQVDPNGNAEQATDYATLHSDIIGRLRREHTLGKPSTLMELLIERVATAYVMTKHDENTGRLTDQRTRKEVNNMFIAMAENVRRLGNDGKSEESVKKETAEAFMRAVDSVSAALDPDTVRLLRTSLADEFERIGL